MPNEPVLVLHGICCLSHDYEGIGSGGGGDDLESTLIVYLCVLSCRLDDYIQIMLREINLDYCRAMNKLIFDVAVACHPSMFSFVTLPERTEIPVPERGWLLLRLSSSKL